MINIEYLKEYINTYRDPEKIKLHEIVSYKESVKRIDLLKLSSRLQYQLDSDENYKIVKILYVTFKGYRYDTYKQQMIYSDKHIQIVIYSPFMNFQRQQIIKDILK